jgi:thiol-disulfide isomerase/thioredoxin
MSLLLACSLLAADKPPADPDKPKKDGDKPKVDPPGPSKLTEQINELGKEFQKEAGELRKAFAAAKTDAEKKELEEKFNKVGHKFAKQILEKAEALPMDPAVVDALMAVAMLGRTQPEGQKAIDLLLANHGDHAKLGTLSMQLGQAPGGEKLLRALHDKAKNDKVKLQAAFGLAKALHKNEATEAEQKEAEKLLQEIKDKGTNAKLPPQLVSMAEKTLYEIRNLSVGKKAPDSESANLDGKTVKVSDYKGKVVVLDFWATWCPPCRGMIPHERELVKKNKDQPFVFISISADEEKDTLKKFLEKEEMPWTHWWSGTGGIVKEWNIEAFPTLYIIDAKGVIRAKIVGGGNEKKIDELVAKLIKEAGTKGEKP